MYYITVCDDDSNFIKYIERKLLESGLETDGVIFNEYNSGEALIKALDTCEHIDLLILDMQMKGMDGHETARYFRKQFPMSIIVFCSGVCMPTVESFEATPFRYLLKEYTDKRMIKELRTVVEELKSKKIEPIIMGMWNHSSVKFNLSEILFFSIAKRGSEIHIDSNKKQYKIDSLIITRKKITDLYMELKDYGFEYAHNSYIVNLNHIIRMTRTELELSDGTKLSIARSKEKELRVAFAKYKSHKY